MTTTKTPYSVIIDLGKITAKSYFLEFEIEGNNFKFEWKESTVGELLEFIKNIDSAFDGRGIKYQVSVEQEVFNFLKKLNSEFKKEHFNLLGPENINKIIEAIIDPILRKDESTGKGVKGKKKNPLTMTPA